MTGSRPWHVSRLSPSSLVVASGYTAQLLSIGSGIMFARGLSATDRGNLAVYLSAITISALLISTGTAEAITIAVRKGWHDVTFPGAAAHFGGLVPHLLASGVAAVVVAHASSVRGAFVASLLYLVFNTVTSVGLGILLGRGSIARYSSLRITNLLVIVVVLAAIVSFGDLTLTSAAWLYTVSEAATATVCLLVVHRGGRHLRERTGEKKGARTTRLGDAGYAVLATLIASVSQSYDRVLIVLVSASLGLAATGNVAVALSTLAPISVAGQSIAPLQLAQAAGSRGQPPSERTPRPPLPILRMALAVAAIAVYLVVLPFLVPIVFGDSYASAPGFAYSLVAGTLAFAVARPLSARLRGMGHARRVAIHEIVALTTLVALGLTRTKLDVHVPLWFLWTSPAVLLVGLHANLIRTTHAKT